MSRFFAWLIAPGLQHLAHANQARHKTDPPAPTS